MYLTNFTILALFSSSSFFCFIFFSSLPFLLSSGKSSKFKFILSFNSINSFNRFSDFFFFSFDSFSSTLLNISISSFLLSSLYTLNSLLKNSILNFELFKTNFIFSYIFLEVSKSLSKDFILS